ncbi:uncharacterized protein TNIN_58981 [Trichonephila inaurata madagascariensis]|uniref:DUF4817 domain-containing protein n=1 Tax=Trichonephila inaurata madagascariensis TaxID=2747483 RepID=A0A8X6X334_9ARAC|nr:uncharacterized protein TNIN_58981 [Trichonephila inaurata madagascariensis]
MVGNLNEEHQRWILKTYWENKSEETMRRIWGNEFNFPASSRLTIYCIRDKFETTSPFANAPKSGQPHTTLAQENVMKVALTFESKLCKKSTQQASWELGIQRTLLQRLKSYYPRLSHDLFEVDLDCRLQLCEVMCNQLTEQPDLLSKIMWTGEAFFKLSGQVNKHSYLCWLYENSHVIMTCGSIVGWHFLPPCRGS